jgi:hypothetical protein
MRDEYVCATHALWRNDSLSAFCSPRNINNKQQGHIRVTELNLGEDFPVLSRARIRPADQPSGGVVREHGTDLSDGNVDHCCPSPDVQSADGPTLPLNHIACRDRYRFQ